MDGYLFALHRTEINPQTLLKHPSVAMTLVLLCYVNLSSINTRSTKLQCFNIYVVYFFTSYRKIGEHILDESRLAMFHRRKRCLQSLAPKLRSVSRLSEMSSAWREPINSTLPICLASVLSKVSNFYPF